MPTSHLSRLGAALAALALLVGLFGVDRSAGPAVAQSDESSEQVDLEPVNHTSDHLSAYVWANRSSTDDYEPHSLYSYNPAGDVKVTRSGTGVYTVTFEGVASIPTETSGVVHVSAYGSWTNAMCTVAYWGPGLFIGVDDLNVGVRCFGPDGEPVDARFVANYTSATYHGEGRFAYFWTDRDAPDGERTLSHDYQYDSQGGPISYERLETGRYRFDMPDNPDSRAFPMVHVTAYNSAATHCQIAWPDGWEVRCVDHDGSPIDSKFTVTYGLEVGLLGHTTSRFGSGTLYTDTISGGSISGDSYVSTVPWGGTQGSYDGTGLYRIAFTDLATSGGHALVNPVNNADPYSWPDGHCVVGYWYEDGSDEEVAVRCYDFNGDRADIHARISFTTYAGVY
ncbi:hypothetical protein [Glycomyces xiaoerkulensis]|uniref:hypothetical protein n=1 Tax=Glycomyces xiaoerkulensis TaxID=2038139 RepID=UPI000C257A0A|nr:hypothetical protein [Glycomyces xiaoerkulensis]